MEPGEWSERKDFFDGLDLATLKYNTRFRSLLLDNSLLRKLAHGYVGADVQYHGKNYLSVPAEVPFCFLIALSRATTSHKCQLLPR
eukprot:2562481-Amphidinium_carterae.1